MERPALIRLPGRRPQDRPNRLVVQGELARNLGFRAMLSVEQPMDFAPAVLPDHARLPEGDGLGDSLSALAAGAAKYWSMHTADLLSGGGGNFNDHGWG
jgi:hypothetical protein